MYFAYQMNHKDSKCILLCPTMFFGVLELCSVVATDFGVLRIDSLLHKVWIHALNTMRLQYILHHLKFIMVSTSYILYSYISMYWFIKFQSEESCVVIRFPILCVNYRFDTSIVLNVFFSRRKRTSAKTERTERHKAPSSGQIKPIPIKDSKMDTLKSLRLF